jgi:urease accessory protein
VKAHTRAVVHPGGRLGELHCTPPLTLRRVHADRPDVCALCLVGSAAGPLAGDELIAELTLTPGARATLAATGAALAQGRGGSPASLAWRVELGHRARLVADPGPLIVCEGSRVDVEVGIALAEDSHLEWRELVVLGRSTDAVPGAATIGWDVTRAGRPLLRQSVALGGTDLGDLGGAGGHRVLASTLLTGPDVAARTVVHTRTSVAQRLDEHTVLLTVLGDGAADVTRALAALRAEF